MAASVNSESPFGQDSQNAKGLAAYFTEWKVLTATLTTSGTSVDVAHGLAGTPDFVVATGSFGVTLGAQKDSISWVTTATTLSLITSNTMAADRPVSVLIGTLA